LTMTTVKTPDVVRNLWKSMLAWGVCTLILGVLVLIWPGISILAAATLFGVYLAVSGIAQIASAFTLDVAAGSRVLWFISGALSLVLAVLAFREFSHGSAVWLLAIWIGVGFTFQGTAETVVALSHAELPGRGWHIFLGVLSIIAGMVVLAAPFDSIVVLAIVTGVWLVVIGISQIVWALIARREVNAVGQRIEKITSSVG
jgi:uncharacterized membrane protein HdeD (DUF308 family)